MSNTKATPGETLNTHQLCVAVFIHAYHTINDNLPSLSEIAHAFDVHGNASYETLQRLIKHGVLERAENPRQYRFARTPDGAAYRAQIVAKHVEQGGAA